VSFSSPTPWGVMPLLADALPPGYRCCSGGPTDIRCPEESVVRARAACRWLPVTDPGAGPLYVDVVVTRFTRRTDALRAVTDLTGVPAGMVTRTLFPPRIGEETTAVRAEATADGARYVLYQVSAQLGCTVGTIAALWRWPAGSPQWVYERLRRLMGELAAEA
jgi:hypothetical protein